MSDGSGLREGTGLDGRTEEGGESKTVYFYRGRGRITGGTSRGRGKKENDEGESSRGGGERGKGRGRMDKKGKRSDKEDKGMPRRDSGKEREVSAGGPGGSIRTLVGRLLTGRFDDGGGIKISGDEEIQSKFDETDRREKAQTSWPSETSAVGGKGEISPAFGGKREISSTVGGKGEISSAVRGKGEISSAVGEKGEMSSAFREKGEMSSAAGGNSKTTRRKLKITEKIDKVRNCSFWI